MHHLERFQNLLLGISILHLARHECQELREIDRAVAISIHLLSAPRQNMMGPAALSADGVSETGRIATGP